MISKVDNRDKSLDKMYSYIKTNNDIKIEDFIYLCGQDLVEDIDNFKTIKGLKSLSKNKVLDLMKAVFSTQNRINNDALVRKIYKEKPWEIFNEMNKDKAEYSFLLDDEERFNLFYNACCMVELTHKNVADNLTLKHIKDELDKVNKDNSWQLKVMCCLIDNPVKAPQIVTEYCRKNNLEEVNYRQINNKIISLYNGITDISDCIFDVINTFEYNNKSNDYCLENLKIYYDFISKVEENSSKNELTVIDPPAQFIMKIINDPIIVEHKFRIIISDSESYKIYKLSEKNNKRIIFNTIDEYLNYLKTKLDKIQNILMFCNQNNKKITNELLKEIIHEDIKIDNFLIFGSDNLIENSINVIAKGNKTLVNRISLFPHEINNQTTPKRKMSVEFLINSENINDEKIKIIQYKIGETNKKSQYIERKNDIYEINKDELINRKQSVRSLYRNEERSGATKRVNKIKYSFTTDLTVEYAIRKANSKYRLDAVMKWNSNRFNLKNTIASKTGDSEDELKSWVMNEYPYVKSNRVNVRKEVSNQCSKLANYDNADIKTLLYLNESLEENIDDIYALNDILNTEVGKLVVNFATEDDITIIAENMYSDYQAIEYKDDTILLLSELYEAAIKHRLIKNNPFKVYSLKLSSEEKALRDIKNNLISRHFSRTNFIEIYRELLLSYNKGNKRALALIVRLLTGVESYVVNCLQWKDFKKVDDFFSETFYQLIIRKRTDNNGKALDELGKLEKYRIIPLPNLLSNILLIEKEKQLKKYGLKDEDDLKEKMIIDGGKKKYKDNLEVFSPSDIDEYKRKVLAKFKIVDEIELILSDDKRRKIDLNNYTKDIFRKNYEYYAIDKCGFDKSEVAYLLGNKQDITFARNYCDYANVCSQLILKVKQDRLSALCDEDKGEFLIHKNITDGFIFSDKDNTNKTELEFYVEKGEDDVDIEVLTKYGYKVSILPSKDDDNEY